MKYTPGLWLFILSAVINLGVIAYCWRFRRIRIGRAFLLLMVCALVWTVGFIFETAAINLELKVLLARIQFLSITYLPVVWLSLILAYTGQTLPWRYRAPILAIPTLTNIVIWTNPLHHWFQGTPRIDLTLAPFPVLIPDYRFWFYMIHAPTGYIFLLAAIIILIRSLRKMEAVYRTQSSFILLAILLPTITDILYVLGYSPVRHYNYTTAVFSISGLIITWTLFRYRFLDLIPLARSVIFANISDGILVFDHKNRLVDINPAGTKIFPLTAKSIGLTIQEIKQASLFHIESLYRQGIFHMEIELDNQPGKFYDMRIDQIFEQNGVLTGWVVTLRDITERMHLFSQIQALATTDSLTGIANRRSFTELCKREIHRTLRQPQNPFAVLMLDLDHFKSINDLYGHAAGDRTLVCFAEKVGGHLRSTDIFGRLGGEEFAILLTNVDMDAAMTIAKRLQDSVRTIHIPDEGGEGRVTVSIGVIHSPQLDIKEMDIETILSLADQALYQAKQQRDHVVMFDRQWVNEI